MKIFKDKNKKATPKSARGGSASGGKVEEEKEISEKTEEQAISDISFSGNQGADAHKILRSFYVSEKASAGIAMNQYVFRVFDKANKSEVKKEVAKLFNVKVKQVRMIHMPKKRRDLGKHPGFKAGFKKAIVLLEEGYTIGQAKP